MFILRNLPCLTLMSWLSQNTAAPREALIYGLSILSVFREIPKWEPLLEEILDKMQHTIHFN